MIDDIVI